MLRSLAVRLVATALTTAVAALALTPAAQATPAVPRAVFDPAETGWLSLRDQTSSAYATRFAQLKSSMMLVDLDVDVIGGSYRVGSVWRPNPDGRGWASLRNLTARSSPRSGPSTATRATASSIRRPTSPAATTASPASGSRTARGSPGPRTAASPRRRCTRATSSTARSTCPSTSTSTAPLPAPSATPRRGCATPRPRLAAIRDRTSAQYSAKFDEYAGKGLRSLVFDSVRTGRRQRYAGIFVENAAAPLVRLPRPERDRLSQPLEPPVGHGLPARRLREVRDRRRRRALLRRLAPELDRPDWPLRAQVDAQVQKELDDTDLPGVSVVARRTARSSTGAASVTRTRPRASGCTAARCTGSRR